VRLRAVLLVAFAVTSACDKGAPTPRERPPLPPPPAPPADAATSPDAAVADVDPMVFCDIAKALLKRGIQCAPAAATKLQAMLDAVDRTVAEVDPAFRSARERTGASCALTAHVYDEQLAAVTAFTDVKCSPTLTADERARTRAYLHAHYGRRTKPRPTGDATIDRQLAELAASRDAMCSCTDRACMHAAHKTVTAAVKPIPREMQDAMADGEAILDEVSRCADRIENNLDRLLP
jgi:hypothetical protein